MKIGRFVSLGLLDEVGPGLYEVHNWEGYQPSDPCGSGTPGPVESAPLIQGATVGAGAPARHHRWKSC